MKRILAIVCIFILLLFTGMPMFTSNLLCNQNVVYADSVPGQVMSDREKVIAALTVYFNDHKGVLKVLAGGSNVDVNKYSTYLTDAFILPFIQYYRFEQNTIESLEDIAEYITVTNDPFIVRLYSPAVSFFNAFLQWMIDNGKISNSPTGSDALYDGMAISGSLFYVFNYNGDSTSFSKTTISINNLQRGTIVNGIDGEVLLNGFLNYNNLPYSTFNDRSVQTNTISNNYYNYSINYNNYYTYNGYVMRDNQNVSSSNVGYPYYPYLSNGSSLVYRNEVLLDSIINCNNGSKNVNMEAAYLLVKGQGGVNTIYCGLAHFNYTNNIVCLKSLKKVERDDNMTPASANLDKDGFDFNPTADPGSDGLEYEPKQSGTGNTYNNYNNYYNDYHEGDTYVTHPGSGGGGSGGDDPGGGSEDPTPGGTTPPWDGSNPGTPSGTLTPVEGGGYNFNLPDLGIPDLNIDWSINGLKDKFPFSIPWDLMAFFAVLNAEPETPEIQATIPLGLWEWEIDWDLHQFDGIALILRNLEFIGFCIGLIVVTRSIIKG